MTERHSLICEYLVVLSYRHSLVCHGSQSSIKFDRGNWSLHYHHAQCFAHLRQFKDSIISCEKSINLFAGYPGTWILLAMSTAALVSVENYELDSIPSVRSCNASRPQRIWNAIEIVQLGLQYCKNHPALLLTLLIAVMKLSDGNSPRLAVGYPDKTYNVLRIAQIS